MANLSTIFARGGGNGQKEMESNALWSEPINNKKHAYVFEYLSIYIFSNSGKNGRNTEKQ